MIKMSFIKLLNTKKRIRSIIQYAILVWHFIIAYTEHQNFGMVGIKINNSLMKIRKVGVETMVVFLGMHINENCLMVYMHLLI